MSKGTQMGRIASDATMLRAAKAELVLVKKVSAETVTQRDAYRARATKAEQDVAEWKLRFDLLLRRDGAPK